MFMESNNPKIEIKPQNLIKKVHNPYILYKIAKHTRDRQLIQSKKAYNKEARNIKKFMEQIRQIKSKASKIQVSNKTNKKIIQNRYDQNQHLQYNFQSLNPQTKDRMKTQPKKKDKNISQAFISDISSKTHRRSTIGNKPAPLPKIYNNILSRSLDKDISPLKIKTKISRQNSKVQYTGRSSPRKRSLRRTIINEKVITITQQLMKKYIKNIHMLLFATQDQRLRPTNQQINQHIINRYKIIKNPYINQSQQPFSLPFCQFFNKKNQRNSIHQIINMTPQQAQKIAFKIYDRNHNGIIDQKDILSIIQLTEQNSQLQNDLLKLIRNFQDKKSSIWISQFNPQFNPRIYRNKTQISQQSILNLNGKKLQVNLQKFQHPIKINTTFRKSKIFTFFQTKQQFQKINKKKNANLCQIQISWSKFKSIFGNQRPAIFYDIIKFLFNCKPQQNKEDINKEQIIKEEELEGLKRYQSIDSYITLARKRSNQKMEVSKF